VKEVSKNLSSAASDINQILTWNEMPDGSFCAVATLEKLIGNVAKVVQDANDKVEQVKGHIRAQTK
jgi:hypothetical protein